ncbi:hypothetical protein JHK85_025560 [Glycine max]|nr:hypothetical protein JHK85_025560 [Glycine max]
MFNENVGVGVDVDENNISCIDDVVNELISMIIIEHDLPYSFVENKRFKELILYLYPKAKIPSRHVVTLNVNKLYENDKQKLKQVLCKLPSRINLTANVWTSCTIERYIALAAHFVDNNWLLQSRINFLIFLLHILVQEGLKVVGHAIQKIRESIKYVKRLEKRMGVFRACVAKVGGITTMVGLHLDAITRWNFTFLMLESALLYHCAFSSLEFEDKSYVNCPTNEEWDRGEKCLIFGSSYPTSNIYFMQVWKIECLLIQNVNNEDKTIRNMTIVMKKKIDKYWGESTIVLCFECILDPRFKFNFLRFCYAKLGLDQMAIQAKLKVVKHKYQTSSQGTSSVTTFTSKNSSLQWNIVNEFIQYENESLSGVDKSYLDTYLEEQNLSSQYHPNLDLLQHWVLNKYRIAVLAENVQASICTSNI